MIAEKSMVGLRALVARIERKLTPQGLVLRKARTKSQRRDLGLWFIADAGAGRVVRKNVNLDEYGHELGVLATWEGLDSDS